MELVVIGIVIIIAIIIAIAVLSKKKPPVGLPYTKKSFLTAAERSFYGVLKKAVGNETNIFPKVTMMEFVKVIKGTEKRQSHFNRISSKHIDFLLCNPSNSDVIAAIELDDKSHDSIKARESDEFKNAVFRQIETPLIRIKAKKAYSVEKLKSILREFLPSIRDSSATPQNDDIGNGSEIAATTDSGLAMTQPDNQKCPECGKEMIVREAKRSANKGQKFWGCSGFPECKTIIEYKEI